MFTDLLSEIGGMYTSLHQILLTLFIYFTRKIYKTSLINKLYAYETVVSMEDKSGLSRDQIKEKLNEYHSKAKTLSENLSKSNKIDQDGIK